MKILAQTNHRFFVASASAALLLAAMGFAGAAKARDNVNISVGINLPGVLVGANNAYPVYSQPRPVYVQPRPVYVQPYPVYYERAPVYYAAPPVYVVTQSGYYQHQRPHGWKHGHYKKHNKHDRDDDEYESREHRGYSNRGYAPVYYSR